MNEQELEEHAEAVSVRFSHSLQMAHLLHYQNARQPSFSGLHLLG